jgi:hypothetical protein
MGRASSSKKVSRAAGTGGGRTARGARPLLWYGAIALVVIVGFGLIISSRADRRALAATTAVVPPVANRDHWHVAYGVYLCDAFAPPITDQRDPKGIHTHGDGIIHTHPFLRSVSGKSATLSVFAETVKMTLNDTTIRMPGDKFYREGSTKCGDKPGIVQALVNGKLVTKDIGKILLKEREHITIAFAPAGTTLPEPPSIPNLDQLTDLATKPTPTPDSTVPGATTDSTAPPATTASESSTTAKP